MATGLEFLLGSPSILKICSLREVILQIPIRPQDPRRFGVGNIAGRLDNQLVPERELSRPEISEL